MTGVLVAALVIGVPAFAFALWPLWRGRSGARTFLALPVDRRQQLEEERHTALRALRELQFEHESGHISDADYAGLRSDYEHDTAAILTELDRLGPVPSATSAPAADAGTGRSAWRHPAALGTAAVVLVAFGIALGVGLARHSAPEPTAGMPAAGSMPPAFTPGPVVGGATPGGAAQPLGPGVVQSMLQAARASFLDGRYGEAISAYQAILKRDPKNLDAMTHLGLIVAIGGHTDSALETFDKVLAIDPNYPAALFYRGKVLYEAKNDRAGAIRSWETFLKVAPPGEDRANVEKMLAEARARR